jgi:hypothetical protein
MKGRSRRRLTTHSHRSQDLQGEVVEEGGRGWEVQEDPSRILVWGVDDHESNSILMVAKLSLAFVYVVCPSVCLIETV